MAVDLSGQKLGKLTVIGISKIDPVTGAQFWKCHCDCGNACIIKEKYLTKSNNTKSCGCLAKEMNTKDLTGQTFGRLTVLNPTDQRAKNGGVIWECACICGNICHKSANYLKNKNNNTRSCGCLAKEKETAIKGQKFGKLTVLELIKSDPNKSKRLWKCLCDCGKEYICKEDRLANGHTKSCGCYKLEIFEKSRIKDYVENTFLGHLKAKKTFSTNTTGVKGVCFNKSTKKYEAYLTFKRKKHSLGYFKTIAEAANARKEGEEKYFKPVLEKYGKTPGF